MGAHLSSYLEGALYKFLNEWINERTLQSTFNNDFVGALICWCFKPHDSDWSFKYLPLPCNLSCIKASNI